MSDLNLLLLTGWSAYIRIDYQLDFSPAQWAGPCGQRDTGLHREIEKGENIEFQCIALESTNVRLYSSMTTGEVTMIKPHCLHTVYRRCYHDMTPPLPLWTSEVTRGWQSRWYLTLAGEVRWPDQEDVICIISSWHQHTTALHTLITGGQTVTLHCLHLTDSVTLSFQCFLADIPLEITSHCNVVQHVIESLTYCHVKNLSEFSNWL